MASCWNRTRTIGTDSVHWRHAPRKAAGGLLGLLLGPVNPGGEHAVEQRLHKRGAEEVVAVRAFEPQAERVLQGAAQRGEGLHVAGVLDALQAGAGVGGQEPGEVGGVAQRRVAEQRPLEVISEVAALGFLHALRIERREGVLVSGKREALPGQRLASGIEADNQEVPVRADQHLAVALQVAHDLGRVCHPRHVLRWPLDLKHAALGRPRGKSGITSLSHRLAGDEQAAVRDPGPAVLRRQDARHRRRESLAYLIQQLLKLSVIGGLRSGLASLVNTAQTFDVGA